MRDDLRRQRLMTAHSTIASKHPHREIFLNAVRPFLLPAVAIAGVLALLVFGARAIPEAVSVSTGLLVLASVGVLTFLIGAGLLLFRPRNGMPRSWRKYM